jgi:Tol biopolymer transport system component
MATVKTILAIMVIFMLASCGTSTPVATTTSIPTNTPQPTAASTPTATGRAMATTAPIPTNTPQPTDTPAPTSLNATGPYIMFSGESGIWITNPDGSFPTQVSRYGPQGDLRSAISPTGDRIALVVENDQGLDLVVVKIPGGDTETIAHLISITRSDETNYPTSEKAFATYAIRDYADVAWQPGAGRLLAFTGAINGSTSDLYLYDTQTGEIKQLTSGLSQSISPTWSPDGQYILNFGVSFGASETGAIGVIRLDGVWAVRVSDGKLITLPKPNGTGPHFVGWQDDSHYITYDSDDECDSTNLRSVDVVSGETKSIMDFSFYNYIAQSPENGALLFSSKAGCASSLGDGTFLLVPGQTYPSRFLDKRAYEIDWLPESKVFYAYPEALFSSDGSPRYDPPVYESSFDPAVSKEGYQAWEVNENQIWSVRVNIPGTGFTIWTGKVSQLIWDPLEGRTLLIVLQDGTLYAASYPDFTARLMGNLGGIDQAIWLP